MFKQIFKDLYNKIFNTFLNIASFYSVFKNWILASYAIKNP